MIELGHAIGDIDGPIAGLAAEFGAASRKQLGCKSSGVSE